MMHSGFTEVEVKKIVRLTKNMVWLGKVNTDLSGSNIST